MSVTFSQEVDGVTKNTRGSERLIKGGAKVIKLASVRKAKASPPTPLQQEALILKYRAKARKLGRSMLRKWHARMDLEEVDSIVDLSLCETVKRFDPSKGASFMTFLFYHLKGNMVRAVASAASANAIPIYNIEDEATNGAEPTHLFGYQFRPLNASEVAEAVISQDAPLPDEVLWKKELNDKSSMACEKLDPLERDIIKRIFLQEQQIMDIAATLGYSRCHVSRVKKKALETLHAELTSSMSDLEFNSKPSFDDVGEAQVKLKVVGRKVIHRRRPRSKVSRAERVITARAA